MKQKLAIVLSSLVVTAVLGGCARLAQTEPMSDAAVGQSAPAEEARIRPMSGSEALTADRAITVAWERWDDHSTAFALKLGISNPKEFDNQEREAAAISMIKSELKANDADIDIADLAIDVCGKIVDEKISPRDLAYAASKNDETLSLDQYAGLTAASMAGWCPIGESGATYSLEARSIAIPSYDCRSADYVTKTSTDDLQEVWTSASIESCEAELSEGDLTDRQTLALETAYPNGSSTDYSDLELLGILYGICANKNPHLAGTDGQLKETQGAALLCPEHPQIEGLKNGDAQAFADKIARDEGRLIGSGKYLIGTDIQPGVWSTDGRVEDCYWELSDAEGNILDNNFVSVAEQLTVEIGDWASGFSTEGCGLWRMQ